MVVEIKWEKCAGHTNQDSSGKRNHKDSSREKDTRKSAPPQKLTPPPPPHFYGPACAPIQNMYPLLSVFVKQKSK